MNRSNTIKVLSTVMGFMFLLLSVSLVAAVDFNGLPEDFEPVIGYTHEFNGGRIILVDDDANWFISRDGVNFLELEPDANLPDGFVPKIAYYHPFSGGRVVLLGDDGSAFIYNSDIKTFKPLALEDPVDGVMEVGYYHGFGEGGRVVLEDNDNTYIWNQNTKVWNVFPLNSFGLLNEASEISYYFDNDKKEVHKWYSDGSVFSWDGPSEFFEITNEFNGLPSGIPDVAYFDKFNDKLVLWFGDDAYVSDNGRDFDLVEINDDNDDDNGDDDNDNDNDSDDDDDNDRRSSRGSGIKFISDLDDQMTTEEICALRGDCPDEQVFVVHQDSDNILDLRDKSYSADDKVKNSNLLFVIFVVLIVLELLLLLGLAARR
jgi:hypothetical protein